MTKATSKCQREGGLWKVERWRKKCAERESVLLREMEEWIRVKSQIKKDVQWLQMGVWFRPAETNVNVCRQTGLRGADRREMVSTCYMPGLLSFLPHSWMTHTQTWAYSLVCGCLPVSSVLSCALCTWGQREGWMSSPFLASPPLIFDPAA